MLDIIQQMASDSMSKIFGLLLQPKVRRTAKSNFPAHCIPNKCHESGWIGITLNAEVMSIFVSQAPHSAILINLTACSMSWYPRENSSRGIRLLILGTVELWGEDKSMISRFFALKFPCGYANGADAKVFEGGFVERSDHESEYDPNTSFPTYL